MLHSFYALIRWFFRCINAEIYRRGILQKCIEQYTEQCTINNTIFSWSDEREEHNNHSSQWAAAPISKMFCCSILLKVRQDEILWELRFVHFTLLNVENYFSNWEKLFKQEILSMNGHRWSTRSPPGGGRTSWIGPRWLPCLRGPGAGAGNARNTPAAD